MNNLNFYQIIIGAVTFAVTMGGVIGGMLLAWSKVRFVKRGELYRDDGTTIYQPRSDCRTVHENLCSRFKNIEKIIQAADDKREKTRDEIKDELSAVKSELANLAGRFAQFMKVNGHG